MANAVARLANAVVEDERRMVDFMTEKIFEI